MADKPGRLKIAVGVGRTYEVPAEAVEEFAGKDLRTALRTLCDKHITDPELRTEFSQLLSEPRLALDLYAGDQETPLSLEDSCDDMILPALVGSQEAELGVAKSHEGGASGGLFGKAGVQVGEPLDARLGEQPAELLDADHQLTDEDLAAIEAGQKLFITGRVLARVEAICREMGSSEVLWYYLGSGTDPVIREVYLPVQRVTSVSCHVSGEDVIRAGREIRRMRHTVLAAGHSHGDGGVFSSHTDWREARTLLLESVARRTCVRERLEAEGLREVKTPDGSALEASLPGGTVSVEISGPGVRQGKDLKVTFMRTRRQASTVFSTHNSRGHGIFPTLQARYCHLCGTKEELELPPSSLAVSILGPIELSDEEKAGLREQLKEKVRKGWGLYYGSSWTGWGSSRADAGVSVCGVVVGEPVSAPVSASRSVYDIWVGTSRIASLDGGVLEEAAAKVPALRAALGWVEPEDPDVPPEDADLLYDADFEEAPGGD